MSEILNFMQDVILTGDSLDLLRTLPSQSVQTVVTSPPYYGLRDYGVVGQIGLEDTPQAYVQRLVVLFREAYRVLRDDGTLWLNLGDSYSRSAVGRKDSKTSKVTAFSKERIAAPPRSGYGLHAAIGECSANAHSNFRASGGRKQLLGIPWRVAFGLQDDGWILRSDIIWAKPSCMPESVKDRPTRSHEYIFLFAKQEKYHFEHELFREPTVDGDPNPPRGSTGVGSHKNSGRRGKGNRKEFRGGGAYTGGNSFHNSQEKPNATVGNDGLRHEFRNRRTVWTVPTSPTKHAHFATFPPDLITPMILAGCPVGGTVLDPFMGSGTTALVAQKYGRHYVGLELNPDYVALAKSRLAVPQTLHLPFTEGA